MLDYIVMMVHHAYDHRNDSAHSDHSFFAVLMLMANDVVTIPWMI